MLDIDVRKHKPPYLVHSDTFRAFGLIRDRYSKLDGQQNLSRLHFDYLCERLGEANLVLPSFNYDFPREKTFDLLRTPSQVGSLSNYVIENSLLKRTTTPMFSFLTNITELLTENNSPFSRGSVFDRMYQMDGTIIFYGTKIDICTYLHFVEDQFGPPLFRYQKEFAGQLVDGQAIREVKVEFHVRPMGLELEYDWNKLNELLLDGNVVATLAKGCFAVKARDISRVWGDLFKKNQFEILSAKTKSSVLGKYQKIGRRFIESDFEVSHDW